MSRSRVPSRDRRKCNLAPIRDRVRKGSGRQPEPTPAVRVSARALGFGVPEWKLDRAITVFIHLNEKFQLKVPEKKEEVPLHISTLFSEAKFERRSNELRLPFATSSLPLPLRLCSPSRAHAEMVAFDFLALEMACLHAAATRTDTCV